MSRQSPRKQPYKHVISRPSLTMSGTINIIVDEDQEIYYTGYNLTVNNIHEGGPMGCRTSYSEEDAYCDLEEMCDR